MDIPEVYKLVHCTSSSHLAEVVNKRMAEGWSLYGVPYCQGAQHYQAMLRN